MTIATGSDQLKGQGKQQAKQALVLFLLPLLSPGLVLNERSIFECEVGGGNASASMRRG